MHPCHFHVVREGELFLGLSNGHGWAGLVPKVSGGALGSVGSRRKQTEKGRAVYQLWNDGDDGDGVESDDGNGVGSNDDPVVRRVTITVMTIIMVTKVMMVVIKWGDDDGGGMMVLMVIMWW